MPPAASFPGIGIMDECARLDITICVDMQIAFPACDTAARFPVISGIFPVIPKIQSEDRLGFTEFSHLFIHEFTLFRCDHQLRYGILTNRHIGEEPTEFGAPCDHLVKIFLTADHIRVLAGIAAGKSKGQMTFFENGHRLLNTLEGSLTSAEVGRFFKPFHTDRRDEVLYPQHFIRKSFIDKSCVGKCSEGTVRVIFAEPDDTFISTPPIGFFYFFDIIPNRCFGFDEVLLKFCFDKESITQGCVKTLQLLLDLFQIRFF